jgi:hypothetical protein
VTIRAVGWARRWAVRLLLYTALTYPFVTAVYLPYFVLVVGYSVRQLEVYLLTSFPFALLAYLVIGPYGKWVWSSIWRIQHGVKPWWRDAAEAASGR